MTAVMVVAGFLFSAVAAYMSGLVGSSNNPLSGITIATILSAALLLLWLLGRDAEAALAASGCAGGPPAFPNPHRHEPPPPPTPHPCTVATAHATVENPLMAPIRNHALTLLALLALAPTASAEMQKTLYSRVELIAEQTSLPATGGTITVGLHLQPDRGWHAYWLNPGDAGKEAAIRWTLPDSFAAADLQFPTPTLIPFGEFNTYGFDDAVLLLTDVAVPPGLPGGTDIELAGRATWVVCDDELCVPEQTNIALTLPVGEGGANDAVASRFAEARDALPQVVDWPARFAVSGERVEFEVTIPDGDLDAGTLFVAPKRFVRYGEQTSTRTANGWRFSMAAGRRVAEHETADAVLGYSNRAGDYRGVRLLFAKVEGPLAAPAPVAAAAAAPVAVANAGEIAKAVLFGLVGGILLNLMPCVFPILSLKALGLADLSRSDAKAARESGVLYTAGVMATFLAIAVLLIVLREAGAAVGWGFQLQSPLVNVGLGLGMVAIGLNLAGVFEIGTRAMGLGQGLTTSNERRAAFFTGALAVLVATPCTAPFMAGALGFALVQPVPVALAVFLALGLGLALPYLALTLMPNLSRWLPKPGAWMATFRHILAFPMFATALWLFWVIGRQLGATAMATALLAALFLGFALWAYGRSTDGSKSARGSRRATWRVTAVAALAACIVSGGQLGGDVPAANASASASAHQLGKLALENFTPQRVVDYVEAETPVFVYFTADWCISCKVNERMALATDAVGEAFNERGIKVVEGDWTAEDPAITEWLAKYDRAGVPLYLYFPAGSSLDSAVVLPQVLLPGIVIDAVDAADAATG